MYCGGMGGGAACDGSMSEMPLDSGVICCDEGFGVAGFGVAGFGLGGFFGGAPDSMLVYFFGISPSARRSSIISLFI